MDPAQVRKVKETLERLEETLIGRIPVAARLSPETLHEDLELLDIVLEVKLKLKSET